MEKRILRITGICGLLLAAVFTVINWRIASGIVLGMICFMMYFIILNASFRDLSETEAKDVFPLMIASMVRIALMALPLLVGILLPEYFNIWGCFAGFMIFKIAAVIAAVRTEEN